MNLFVCTTFTTSNRSPPPAARALDRLGADDEPASAGLAPCALILACSCGAVRAAAALLAGLPWPSFGCQLLAEALAAVYLVDLVSGILHATLDYCDPGPALREVLARSKAAVHRTREQDPRYVRAGPWRQAGEAFVGRTRPASTSSMPWPAVEKCSKAP